MATIKIQGLREKRRKDGTTVFYWESWPAAKALGFDPTPLRDAQGDALDRNAAMAAALARNAEVERALKSGPRPAATSAAGARSFQALITRYQASDAFRGLAPETQRGYRDECKVIVRDLSDIAVNVFGLDAAKRWLKTFKLPSRRAGVGRVLRLLMTFAKAEKWIAINPLKGTGEDGLSLPSSKVRVVTLSYTGEALLLAAARAKGEPAVALAIVAATCTGQRETDVLALGEHLRHAGGGIALMQSKRKKNEDGPVWGYVPLLLPRLTAEVEAEGKRRREAKIVHAQHLGKWIVNPRTNKPYKAKTFQGAFARVRDCAVLDAILRGDPLARELAGIQFRDLRDTFITRANLAGCDPVGVCAVSGHFPPNLPMTWKHYLQMSPELARRALVKLLEYESALGVDKLFGEA